MVPARDAARNGQQPRIVLVAPEAVRLQRQRARPDGCIRVRDLHPGSLADDQQAETRRAAPATALVLTRNGCVTSLRPGLARQRHQHPDDREVGDQGGPAVAEERQHDARERHQVEHAAGDQADLQRQRQRQPERQEEAVVGLRAQCRPDAEPHQHCIQHEQREDSERSPTPRRARPESNRCGRRA